MQESRAQLSDVAPKPGRTAEPAELRADIIILDWNRAEHTIAAIQSALQQTGVQRKIWVVDQGSDPANCARLAAFCEQQRDVHVLWLKRNIGVAAGRNVATRLGDAPFVISLDNDAVFADDGCVARAVQRLQDHPALGALAFRVLDAQSKREQCWDYPREYLGTNLESFEVTRFLGGGHALRREAFERAGGYDESLFFSGEERDVAWRMLKHGYRMRWCRDLAVYHRPTETSKVEWNGQRFYFMARNALYINHKFGAGAAGFARSTVGLLMRGFRNRVPGAAVRGILSGLALSVLFSLDPQDKSDYALSEDVRLYIAETDMKLNETPITKLRRLLRVLPKV